MARYEFGVTFVAAGVLGVAVGCRAADRGREASPPGALLQPLKEPAATALGCCESLKDRVHVFAVNGVDPLCLGNLHGLCADLRGQGYRHTRFGRLLTSHGFAGQIRKIRCEDPGARIVLIGFSYGCNYVRSLANALGEDGVRVDLLVYIAGDLIRDEPASRPENVGRVLNIRASGMAALGGDLFFNRGDIAGGRNVRLGCRHFFAPSRPETLDLVLQELTAVTLDLAGCCPPPSSPEAGR